MKPPTWAKALPTLIKASRSIWPSRRAAAMRELERMAKLADDRIEWLKQEALDRQGVALKPLSWATTPEHMRRVGKLSSK